MEGPPRLRALPFMRDPIEHREQVESGSLMFESYTWRVEALYTNLGSNDFTSPERCALISLQVVTSPDLFAFSDQPCLM